MINTLAVTPTIGWTKPAQPTANAEQRIDTMSNKPITFLYLTHTIRVLTIHGNPWIVVADICRVLDYVSPNAVVSPLGTGERAKAVVDGKESHIVSEKGLASILRRAQKRVQVAEFKDWADTVVFQRKRSEFPCVSRSSTVTAAPTLPRTSGPSAVTAPAQDPREELTHRTARSEDLTMSSLEIAERTGKTHYNVLTDISKMFQDVGDNALQFQGVYTDKKGERRPCYHLPEIYVLTLITGYSIPLRKAVIERWRELEAQVAAPVTSAPALPNFSNPGEAARAWADEWEKRQAEVKLREAEEKKRIEAERQRAETEKKLVATETKLIAAQPKITLAAQIGQFERSVSAVARKFEGVNVPSIKQSLGKAGYLYKGKSGAWRVYAQYRKDVFIEKFGENGKGEIYATDKGHEVIAELYQEKKLIMLKGF